MEYEEHANLNQKQVTQKMVNRILEDFKNWARREKMLPYSQKTVTLYNNYLDSKVKPPAASTKKTIFAHIVKYLKITSGKTFKTTFIPKHTQKVNPHVAYDVE